jgi:3-methylcrotonyl-CoA carboxylase alpha subunit
MKRTEFQRILVANRAEIASRVIRAIHGLEKVALVVYADPDRDLPCVTEADEAYSLGSGDLSETYLDMEKILRIARETRADAIHPGYGFLSENAEFAQACEESGIHFIGPSARVISLMGNKSRARETASELGIPVLEGERGELDALLEKASTLPFPLLVKPAAGGGGKGMRIVHSAVSFEQEAREAYREALSYFGTGELYVERFLKGARHIEVQVLADQQGNGVHLFERECSLQRRYQKIIEEAPSASLTEGTRSRITAAALALVRGIGYTSAGTVEFLLDENQDFYFMEMNTRIQVEHPVTELITGTDLVREQIAIAQGDPLSFNQDGVSMRGHALEARIYAEDPLKDFLPSAGTLLSFELPGGNGTEEGIWPAGPGVVRADGGYRAGNRVQPWYDPMLAKIIVAGEDREDARRKMISALKETHISGLATNRDFLVGLLGSDAFRDNRIHTGFLDTGMKPLLASMEKLRSRYEPDVLLAAAAFISLYPEEETAGGFVSPWQLIGHWRILPGISLQWDQDVYPMTCRSGNGPGHLRLRMPGREVEVRMERRNGNHYGLRVNGRLIHIWGHTDRSEVHLDMDGQRFSFRRTDIPDRRYISPEKKKNSRTNGEISAPLNGKVVRIHVKEGDRVAEGEAMIVIESMKMENKILSDHEAVVQRITVSAGQQVQTNQILLTLASI